MTGSTKLRSYQEFSSELKKSRLPGTEDPKLLHDIYTVAQQRLGLEERGRVTKYEEEPKLRRRRSQLAKALRKLKKASKEIDAALDICSAAIPRECYWLETFNPAKEAIRKLTSSVDETRDLDLTALHPKLRKGESPLFQTPVLGHRYELDRFGSKPAFSWFLLVMDRLVEDHFSHHPGRHSRDRLIKKVLSAAFGENLSEDTIKTDLYRLKQKKRQPAR